MKGKKDSLKWYKVLTILTFVVIIFLLIKSFIPPIKIDLSEIAYISDLSTVGYLKTDVDATIVDDRGFVTLQSDCYRLVAITEAYQAESIYNGLARKIEFRPNTHDLMRDALNSFDINIEMVKIVEIKNNTFIGRIILKQGNKIVSLDSRPSDGVALAVRTNSPIYIKESLMKEQGEYIC